MKKCLFLITVITLFMVQVQLLRDGGRAFGLGVAGGLLGGAIGSAMAAPRETVVYTQPIYKEDTSNLEQQLAEQQAQIEELKQQLAQQQSDNYQEIE